MELILVDSVIHHRLRVPPLRRHEAVALHHCDVEVGAGAGGLVLDVEVALVVDLLDFVVVHVVVVGAGGFDVGVAVVDAG